MIRNDMQVQWMDVNSQKVYMGSLQRMFQMYSHKSQGTSNDTSEIIFNSEKDVVKITDWHGWTDLRALRRKIFKPGGLIYTMKIWGHELVASGDTLIPIYEPDIMIEGFHGETKYPFIIKHVSELISVDMLRVRRSPEEFSNFRFLKWEKSTEEKIMYEIETRSGFFNCSNVYLWGKPNIPEDYCLECPNNGSKQCALCYIDRRKNDSPIIK